MGHCHLRARLQVSAGTGKAELSPGVPPPQLSSPRGDRRLPSGPTGCGDPGVLLGYLCGARSILLSTPSSSPNPGLPPDPRWAF